jgi:hypothetical protein
MDGGCLSIAPLDFSMSSTLFLTVPTGGVTLSVVGPSSTLGGGALPMLSRSLGTPAHAEFVLDIASMDDGVRRVKDLLS